MAITDRPWLARHKVCRTNKVQQFHHVGKENSRLTFILFVDFQTISIYGNYIINAIQTQRP